MYKKEVKIHTCYPDGGKTTLRGTRARAPQGVLSARKCLVEVLGALRFRTKVKRRKAWQAGKSASSDNTQYPFVACCVLATGSKRILYILPAEFCRVPRTRGRPEDEKDKGR
jgi:hypothetical protein